MLAVALAVLGAALFILGRQFDLWAALPEADPKLFRFADGFEDAESLDDLFPRDGRRWHGFQKEPERNTVVPSSEQARSGTKSLKCAAVPQQGNAASKADIVLTGLRFVKADHVWFTGWFRLAGETDATCVFLWDLEASKKRHSPGRRLYLQSGECLASDLGKWWTGETFRQPKGGAVSFPKNRWTRLRIHLFLSERSEGKMEVWQDGTKVLDANGQTLPTASTVYGRLQIGLTVNGNLRHAQILYVDDVLLSNRPLE